MRGRGRALGFRTQVVGSALVVTALVAAATVAVATGCSKSPSPPSGEPTTGASSASGTPAAGPASSAVAPGVAANGVVAQGAAATDVGASAAGGSATAAASGEVPRADAGAAAALVPSKVAADPTPWVSANALAGKAVGNTSVAFKLKLEGGLEALFKPRSKRHDSRYRGEAAAYRLAIALGLPNVPAAFVRTFSGSALQRALGEGSSAASLLAAEAVPLADGSIPGALLPWRPRFDVLALEKPSWRAKWTAWLDGSSVPTSDEAELARQVSTMIAFDYVTGNWDRWSGGNIAVDEPSGTLLFVDNDGAFYEEPPRGFLTEQKALVTKAARFSRSFVDALDRVATVDDLARIVGEERPGAPLLSKKALEGALRRKGEVVAHVRGQIGRYGEAKVLAYP